MSREASSSGFSSGAGFFREACAIYAKEVRSLVRDRHTVIYSVLLPLFLYPALVWGMLQIAAYAKGVEEREESILGLVDRSDEKELGRFLESRPKMRVTPLVDAPEAALAEILRSGAVHVVVVCSPTARGAPEGALPVASARVEYRSSQGSSVKARDRLVEALEDFRREKLLAASREAGESEAFLEVLRVEKKDLSTPQETANYIASLILPLVLTVMTALGALYPALDTTVGEKERGTLETTLVSPVRRISLVCGKYLAVATFALAASILNFGSMAILLVNVRSQLKLEKMSIGFGSAAIILGAAVLLALLLSAVMMLIGFVARTFKEGQAYVTPVYLLAVVPAVFTSSPDATLTPGLACLPIVNISLLFREALQGSFPAAGIALTMVTSAVYGGLALACAARLLRREAFATGDGLRWGEAIRALLGPG